MISNNYLESVVNCYCIKMPYRGGGKKGKPTLGVSHRKTKAQKALEAAEAVAAAAALAAAAATTDYDTTTGQGEEEQVVQQPPPPKPTKKTSSNKNLGYYIM